MMRLRRGSCVVGVLLCGLVMGANASFNYGTSIPGRCQKNGVDYAFHYSALNGGLTEVQCKAWCDNGGTSCVGYSWRPITTQCAFHKETPSSVVPNHAGGSAGTLVNGAAQNGVPDTGTADTYWTCHPRTIQVPATVYAQCPPTLNFGAERGRPVTKLFFSFVEFGALT